MTTKLAIMQPYFFPYIGYFQLINAVDKFVILDDVNFITKGWINRNRILLNNKIFLFTIPLKGASQNRLIKDIEISSEVMWKNKMLKSLGTAYRKAPLFNKIFPIIVNAIHSEEHYISGFALKSVIAVTSYLDIKTKIVTSSAKYNNGFLKAEDKIIDICKKEGATQYINPIGGRELYSTERFMKEGIELKFMNSKSIKYVQFDKEFIPRLSIIDVLMMNSKEQILSFMNEYELI